jgi:hypothetical protein
MTMGAGLGINEFFGLIQCSFCFPVNIGRIFKQVTVYINGSMLYFGWKHSMPFGGEMALSAMNNYSGFVIVMG